MSNNLKMFGVEDIKGYAEGIKESITYKTGGIAMILISFLSDVQEMIAHGSDEQARQTLNVVKYLISTEVE